MNDFLFVKLVLIMINNAETFKIKSGIKSTDTEHRRKINFNIGKYDAAVIQGKKQFENFS